MNPVNLSAAYSFNFYRGFYFSDGFFAVEKFNKLSGCK